MVESEAAIVCGDGNTETGLRLEASADWENAPHAIATTTAIDRGRLRVIGNWINPLLSFDWSLDKTPDVAGSSG